jgi:hypothetical protein
MIWVHTYDTRSGKHCRTTKSVHTEEAKALANQVLFGGTVDKYMSDHEVAVEKIHITNAVNAELSDIIDDFSKHDAAFYGSSGWDCKKVRAINMISQIIDGDF